MKKFKNMLGGRKDRDDKKGGKETPSLRTLRTRHSVADGLRTTLPILSEDSFTPTPIPPRNSVSPFPALPLRSPSPTPGFQTTRPSLPAPAARSRSIPQTSSTTAAPNPLAQSTPAPRPAASNVIRSSFLSPASRKTLIPAERRAVSDRGPGSFQGLREAEVERSRSANTKSPPDSGPVSRESTESAAKRSPLLVPYATRNKALVREKVGAPPAREASKKSQSASKGQENAGVDSDSGSTISIGKVESSDSDSDLDIEDLLALMMAARHDSGLSSRNNADITEPMEALLLEVMLSKARNAAEGDKPSTREKQSAEKRAPPAASSRPAQQRLATRDTPGTVTASAPSQPVAKKVWPPPTSSPKFKVPVLKDQKGVPATSLAAEASTTKSETEPGSSSVSDFLVRVRARQQLRERMLAQGESESADSSTRFPTTRPSERKAPPVKAPAPKPPARDSSPTPASIALARSLHEKRVAAFQAAAAATRALSSDDLPPPTDSRIARSVSPSPRVRHISSSVYPPPSASQPMRFGGRAGVGMAQSSAPQKKKEPAKQAAGPKFKVPVLSESERAAMAARTAISKRGWDGWD